MTTIISKQPTCKTCNKLMLEWNPFANEHEHVECMVDRVSTKLTNILIKQLIRKLQ